MAPSWHDWKIVDWDVKPQHNQPTILIITHTLINTYPQFGLEKWSVFWQFLEKYQPLINTHVQILAEKDNLMKKVSESFVL